MTRIEYLDGHIVYQNPRPHVHSRQAYHPGLVRLANGEILALFMMGEAFEAPNCTTWISRSCDEGRTWTVEGPLYDKSALGVETTDTFKATLLADGTLVATGYRFRRDDLEEGIAIASTGGFLPGDNVVSRSIDHGRSWSPVEVMPRSTPELLELSGPCVQTASGDLVGVAGFYLLPDGTNPSGPFGAVVRSRDGGRTWDDRTRFLPDVGITPWENRLCEMQPGRLVAIVWAYDAARGRHLANQIVVSHDNGESWAPPIDTGIFGQASNLIWLGGERLLTIHAHRGDEPGIWIRVVDFTHDRWQVMGELPIWGRASQGQTSDGQLMVDMFASLKFGQPSLLRLNAEEFLAAHWSIEDGQGLIRAHRLRVSL